MKIDIYTKRSIIALGFALVPLLIILISEADKTPATNSWGLKGGVLCGYLLSIVFVPISIIVSLVALIKERTARSVIICLISQLLAICYFFVDDFFGIFWNFILVSVCIIIFLIVEDLKGKRNRITNEELLDVYEKISGKRPLHLFENRVYLLDILKISSDAIGDGDILLQYETANLRATNYQLKKLNVNISDYRDKIVIQYIPCEEDDDCDYKIRYYCRYSRYKYQHINKSYNKIHETDNAYIRYDDYQWGDSLRADYHHLSLLDYYMEHKSEIPVIAEEEMSK